MTFGRLGKADLHLHTSFSDGMASARQLLDHVEAETELDVIAITDHDDIRGAWHAREVWARNGYRFDLIVGVEVTCVEGHLLALFLESPVPGMRRLEETLEAVHRQGGIAIAPHPMNPFTRSLGLRHLRLAARREGRTPFAPTRGSRPSRASGRADGAHLDGIEITNCSPGSGLRRARVLALNRSEFGLAEIGASDAHFLDFVGAAYTAFPGATAADLKQAILHRRTEAMNGIHPTWRRIGARRIAHQTFRGIMTTPRRMGWPRTSYSFVRRIFRLP